MNRDICFKFGTDIEDRPLLRPDHTSTRNCTLIASN